MIRPSELFLISSIHAQKEASSNAHYLFFSLETSAHVKVDFQWGPSMEQVYNDIDDQFANAVNGRGTLSDGLNAVQQSTVTYMKKQGFSVST